MLKTYKIYGEVEDHLIISNDGKSHFVYRGGDWKEFKDRVVLVRNYDPFEFKTNRYYDNGLIRLGKSSQYVLDLKSGEIINISNFNKEITLKSGNTFQLYRRRDYNDIIIMKKGTAIGCNISSSGYVGGLYDKWTLEDDHHSKIYKVDKVTINIECFGDKLDIRGSYPARDCIVDLTNKELIDVKWRSSRKFRMEFKSKYGKDRVL